MLDQHHRRSIRLQDYDYAAAGAYFVTICVHDRVCLFGTIESYTMHLNHYGQIACWYWQALPDHFDRVRLDAFVVMPVHVHGIIWIVDHDDPAPMVGAPVGAQHAAPLRRSSPASHDSAQPRVEPGSLGAIVRSYKAAVTRQVNLLRETPAAPLWQRNYYEHIIRDDDSLLAIRAYIATNPPNWQTDDNYLPHTQE